MPEYLLILRARTGPEWTAPEDVRLRRALKMLLRAWGLAAVHGPVPLPAPGAETPVEFVACYLMEGEGCLAALPEDVAALEALVAEAGRRALAGLLDLTEGPSS